MDKKQEKAILENILRFLRKGKFELTGDEVLSFHQGLVYLITSIKQVDSPPSMPQEIKSVVDESEVKISKKKSKE